MKVKGKALEEFDNWIIIQEFWDESFDFEELHESMKWGVYQDFFDSVGMVIDIQPFMVYDNEKYIGVDFYIISVLALGDGNNIDMPDCKTRQEAREKAIEKAVEIFNERV